jgi:hypothetical protein
VDWTRLFFQCPLAKGDPEEPSFLCVSCAKKRRSKDESGWENLKALSAQESAVFKYPSYTTRQV